MRDQPKMEAFTLRIRGKKGRCIIRASTTWAETKIRQHDQWLANDIGA
jgi:hypothetical protein